MLCLCLVILVLLSSGLDQKQELKSGFKKKRKRKGNDLHEIYSSL
jgi:hypothetical protein